MAAAIISADHWLKRIGVTRLAALPTYGLSRIGPKVGIDFG
jgi:hypothetical protein